MKRLLVAMVFVVGMLASGPALGAQHPLLSLVPDRPLVIVAGKDMKATYDRLAALEAVGRHAKSKDRERFDDSKLRLKLKARADQFSDFVGHKVGLDTLMELAGRNAVLALYDIGQLRFLYLSDLGWKGQTALAYLDQYNALPTRKVGQRTYHVKEDPEKGLAFALYRTDGLVAVSNDVTLIERALSGLEEPGRPEAFVDSEPWVTTLDADRGVADATTLLALDMARLIDDRYFTNYWAFRNRQALQGTSLVVAGIEVQGAKLTERRLVLGAKKRSGRALIAEDLKGAWWSEAGPGKKPRQALHGFFGWPAADGDAWERHVRGRLLTVQAHDQSNGPVRFAKAAAILVDAELSADVAVRSILDGVRGALLIVPENLAFVTKDMGVHALEPVPGFGGAYVAKDGDLLFLADDLALLSKLRARVVVASESNLEEAARVDLADQLPLWARAFRQMGPEAAFASHDAGAFFALELADLIDAASAFRLFTFRAHRQTGGVLIQDVSYGK